MDRNDRDNDTLEIIQMSDSSVSWDKYKPEALEPI